MVWRGALGNWKGTGGKLCRMTSRTPQNAVLAAVDELHGVLSLAEALLLAGRSLDLQGLETEVRAICDAAAALPPEEGRGLRGALAGLLSQVEGLRSRLARSGLRAGA